MLALEQFRNAGIIPQHLVAGSMEYVKDLIESIGMRNAKEKAAELGCGALCFDGNIGFYGKSGFKEASEFGIRYHVLEEEASFILCRE